MSRMVWTLGALAALMLPTQAEAHARLTTSTPADNGAVAADAKELTLVFDELIRQASCTAVDGQGRQAAILGLVLPEREKVHVALKAPVAAGSYVLNCSVAGPDGHQVPATLKFSVAK